MSSAVLQRRRGIRVLSGESAAALDVRMSFSQRGLWGVEPRFANLEGAPGEHAHGVLYRLAPEELAALKRWEALGYRDTEVRVRRADGEIVAAHAFQARWPARERPPSRRYLNLLIAGAEEHGLPADYVAMLRDAPVAYVPLLSPFAAWLAGRERWLPRFRRHP